MNKINVSSLNSWKDIKIFRDPVHQYIEVPKAYVNALIDTYDMQRIKDVAQSGLRSVFNAATHDRFSHSLGVYHLGKKAFKSLKTNILNIVDNGEFTLSTGKTIKISSKITEIRKCLEIWEVLFHIGCILHDIGHPAMSHTLEFLYDEMYLCLEDDETPLTISEQEYERYHNLHKDYMCGKSSTIFQSKLAEKLLGDSNKAIKGNPHERMSAYYILMGLQDNASERFKVGSFTASIVNLIKSYLKEEMNYTNEEYNAITDNDYEEYLKFICRMIIGQTYEIDMRTDTNIENNFIYSVKNAIINLLNGHIDADSLDYIARNSYSAGYDTNKVDVNRMCSAYSVKLQNNVLIPVFEKNALSVLEGFISARNYEPNWLYSHHKIVYSIDVLYKCLYKCAVDILYKNDLDKWSKILTESLLGKSETGLTNSGEFYKKNIEKYNMSEPETFSEKQLSDIVNEIGRNFQIEELMSKLAESSESDEPVQRGLSAKLFNILLMDNKLLDNSGEFKSEIQNILDNPNMSQLLDSDNISSLKQYADRKKQVADALIIILNKRTEDLLDSGLKNIICKTREYLFKDQSPDKFNSECVSFLIELAEKYSELIDIKNLYFSYIISPCRCFENDRFSFYRSNDSDIDALFKKLYFNINNKKGRGEALSKTEKTYSSLAKEYFERGYKRSIWKSYQEYRIFINDIAASVNMDVNTVNRYFLELIKLGGKAILFHNDNQTITSSEFEKQKIFTNYSESDFKALSEIFLHVADFRNVFKDFNDSDFVIRIHSVKYKNFSESIKIAFKNRIFKLGEIIDISDLENREFPYIYVAPGDKDIMFYREALSKELIKYCLSVSSKYFNGQKEEISSMQVTDNGKRFRDVVHGDIIIPQKFLTLIDTKAFQRLRRIKQLSTADLVFPNAAHTRFSHCIGTFYVMTNIIEHFKTIFNNIRVSYEQNEIDALLVTALLHDIGHGPYSHNFERLPDNKKSHEEWTVEIIEKDAEIRQALMDGFPDYNIDEFIQLIKSYVVEDGSRDDNGQLSFHTIFKSLISSQMDADRFDYLLRDSFNTGIVYGKIDVNAIIQGMKITEYKNKFYVCISENTVSYVEQFLFGRYKMYDSVYYNAYKVFSEALVIKILSRVKKHPEILKQTSDDNIFALLNNTLSLPKYLTLDDSYINGLFGKWQDSDDKVLSELCSSLLQRHGFERIYAMNQSREDMYNFKQELKKLFNFYFPGFIDALENLNSFIFVDREFTAYKYISTIKKNKKKYSSKIWVLTNDGLLKDFADVSPMFSAENKSKWDTYKCFIYYSRKLLDIELDNIANKDNNFDTNKEELLSQIDQLIKNSNLRNHIEIEEKYTCTLADLDKVKEALNATDSEIANLYNISKAKTIKQRDVYYDTQDLKLANNNCSFRCRKRGDNEYIITIKRPTPNGSFDKNSQVARFEYEKKISSEDITEALDFIKSNLKEILPSEMASLTKENMNKVFIPQLYVNNNRTNYYISDSQNQKGYVFNVSLDNIIFEHNSKKKSDYQIEVELESDYIHRVSMKFFTRKLETLLFNVEHEKTSKYIKGLMLFGMTEMEK